MFEVEISDGPESVFDSDEFISELTRRAWENPPPPSDVCVLPDGLEGWEPGLVLAMVLDSVDVSRLSGEDLVRVLVARNRMVAHYQAATFEAMNAIADSYAGEDLALVNEGATAEIRAALRMTRRSAESELALAHDLRVRLPRVWEALAAGVIDRRRAFLFIKHTEHLSIGQAREVCDVLVEDAGRWTTGQLTERIRKACIGVNPDDAARRCEQSIAGRRLVSYPDPDGTLTLAGLGLPAVRASEALDRINRLAKSLKTGSEPRTMDQLRADIFLDLLCGDTQPGTRGSVHITVDLATLARLVEDGGELAGYGPVITDIARQTTKVLGPAPWTFTVTDPNSGLPVHDGTTRRRPTSRMKRRVQHRYQTCVFPGCRTPSVGSDLDHRRPWQNGGTTTDDNLAPLCRTDHCIRHQTGWTYEPLPDGDFLWTSPLGAKYTTSGRDP